MVCLKFKKKCKKNVAYDLPDLKSKPRFGRLNNIRLCSIKGLIFY